MEWTKSSGTLSFTTEDGIPCWNLNAGTHITSTRTTLGDSYTLFYYWKPRESDTLPNHFRTLHTGWSEAATALKDHWVLVGPNNKNLGMYSHRNGNMRDSGYDITIEWQTLIVTGVASTPGTFEGTSTFYVNGVQVLKDGEHTGATPGRVVRGPGWKGHIVP